MKNRIENAIIAAASAIVAIITTIFIIQLTSIRPLQRQIDKQNVVIIELAKIEKYRYEISNEFGKMKPKDSQLIINLDNKLDALTIVPADTITSPVQEKEENLLQRIFRKR